MSRVRIGDLDRRMTLERPIDTPDDIGGVTRSWVPVAQIWANVQPARGSFAFAGERAESVLSHRVTIRWRPDVTGAMRLRDGDRIFIIHAALDGDMRRRTMVCQCEERV